MSEEKKKNWFIRHKFLTAIVVVVALIGIGSAMGGSGGSLDTGTTTDQNREATQDAPAEEEPTKLSSQEIYDKVQPGMTKAEIVKIAGHDPDNCINSESGVAGTSETCSYGTLSLIFLNGELESKTKL